MTTTQTTSTPTLHRAVCTCGRYRSRAFRDGNLASMYGENHAAAMADAGKYGHRVTVRAERAKVAR